MRNSFGSRALRAGRASGRAAKTRGTRGRALAWLIALGALALPLSATAQEDAPALSPEQSPEQIEVAQVVLQGLELYRGEATGKINAETREAIKAFQGEVGLEPTGVLDLETADALIQLAELATGAMSEDDVSAEGADDEPLSEEEALALEAELLRQGLLGDGGALLDEEAALLEEEEAIALEEELAQLSEEELAELTAALGVECRGFNIQTETPVTGSCVDGQFEGEDEFTGNAVVGKCKPAGDLDARDQVSGEGVFGTCR